MLQKVRERIAALHACVNELTYHEQQGLMIAFGGVAVSCFLFHRLAAYLVLFVGVVAAAATVYLYCAVCDWETGDPEEDKRDVA